MSRPPIFPGFQATYGALLSAQAVKHILDGVLSQGLRYFGGLSWINSKSSFINSLSSCFVGRSASWILYENLQMRYILQEIFSLTTFSWLDLSWIHFLFKYSTLYCLSHHFHVLALILLIIYLFLQPYGCFSLLRYNFKRKKRPGKWLFWQYL